MTLPIIHAIIILSALFSASTAILFKDGPDWLPEASQADCVQKSFCNASGDGNVLDVGHMKNCFEYWTKEKIPDLGIPILDELYKNESFAEQGTNKNETTDKSGDNAVVQSEIGDSLKYYCEYMRGALQVPKPDGTGTNVNVSGDKALSLTVYKTFCENEDDVAIEVTDGVPHAVIKNTEKAGAVKIMCQNLQKGFGLKRKGNDVTDSTVLDKGFAFVFFCYNDKAAAPFIDIVKQNIKEKEDNSKPDAEKDFKEPGKVMCTNYRIYLALETQLSDKVDTEGGDTKDAFFIHKICMEAIYVACTPK